MSYNLNTDFRYIICIITETRQSESSKIREKFPGRIPVICERAAKSDIPVLDKEKFLVPSDITGNFVITACHHFLKHSNTFCPLAVGEFSFIVRQRLNLPPEKALFLFLGRVLPPTTALMREVYSQHKDVDGFLYVNYTGESTFGGIIQLYRE